MEDAKKALHIYGPDIEGIKGKMMRNKPQGIEVIQTVDIPSTINDLHPRISLSADYLYVQGIAFYTVYQVDITFGQLII